MLPIIDYDDMVKAGSAKPSLDNLKSGQRKYAVIIKNASAQVGKFDITDKLSTQESIFALQNNCDIPEVVRKSAEYYVNKLLFIGVCHLNLRPHQHRIRLW